MDILSLAYTDLRQKTAKKIKDYLALSDNHRLTVGVYVKGKFYVFGNPEEERQYRYDMGSVSKTITAHLILKLCEEGILDLSHTVDAILPLKEGKYPTIHQLLTHTAGYHHLTPVEVTVPSLLAHGYARKNLYGNCTDKSVIKCLERRRFFRQRERYGYSDFAFAILAVVAQEVTRTPFAVLFEEFIQKELGLNHTVIEEGGGERQPLAAMGRRILPFGEWERKNPYIAGGGVVSNIEDVLRYLALQIESDEPYITSAHVVCRQSQLKNDNHLMCMGWHTYKKSDQLWHVGGVGTFRSSVIANRKRKIGVAVLGNAKGKAAANVHYIAKMIYSELKNKRIGSIHINS